MCSKLTLRPAESGDGQVLFDLILALADYEKLLHAVTGNADALEAHLFSPKSYAKAILAEYAGQAVGFALFFHSYSTFLTKPGIYLEDLFILPQFRRKGIGKAVLSYLAQLTLSCGGQRLEWSVLDWNELAIAVYRRLGASILENPRICRVTGDALTQLANGISSTIIRSAVPADIAVLFRLIQGKAEPARLFHTFSGSPEALKKHLFGSRSYAEAILAEQAGQVVGFALFFYNYSTFLTRPGLYLDELFVLPEHQRQGIDKALLSYLGQLAVVRNCGRVEWLVEVWNEPAIAFYERIGASILPDWRICQVTGDALTQLAAQASPCNIY